MRIGLVTYVPDDLVARGVKQRVKRHGNLASPQVGAEVPPDLPHRVDDVLAHLLRYGLELLVAETVEVLGLVDRFQ